MTKVGKPGSEPRASYRDVARHLTSRTTDLIAISIVLVASLTFGRQVLRWWHAAPAPENPFSEAYGNGAPWTNGSQHLSLEFGDLPLAMTRQVVPGDREEVIRALVAHCTAAATATTRPWRDRDDAEDRLLAKAAGLSPVAEEPGVWSVYVLDERFPLVAAFRQFEADSQDAARGSPRLVCWGIAMRAGDNVWNAYVFTAAVTGKISANGLPNVPFPPGARRNLSLRDERGGALVGFSGSGPPEQWMKFYDGWFAEKGWAASGGWTTGGGAWSARFQSRLAGNGARVEIQFAEDSNHDLSGLMQIVAARDVLNDGSVSRKINGAD